MDITLVVTFVCWFFGGFAMMVTGFGGALVVLPVLVFFVDLRILVLATIVSSFLGCVLVFWRFRKSVDWRACWILLLSSLPGSLLGVLSLKFVPIFWLEVSLGLMLLLYVVWQAAVDSGVNLPGFKGLESAPARGRAELATLVACGGFSGLCTGAVSLGGPPMAVCACLMRWPKDLTRGVFGAFFSASVLVTIAMDWWYGLFTPDIVPCTLATIPGMLLGQLAALPAARNISQDLFRKALLFFIFLGGLTLLGKALLP